MSNEELFQGILDILKAHTDEIDRKLERLASRPVERASYTVEEIAVMESRAPYTVREWCRLGQLRAEKTGTQSGPHARWTIPAAEYSRFQREGLLPIRRHCG